MRYDLEECREFIRASSFRLQPKHYGRDYPKWPGLVGIEVEMLPLLEGPNTPQTVPLYGSSNSLSENLMKLAFNSDDWTCQISPEEVPAQLYRVLMEVGDQLSFEPGGQLEISTVPYPCLSDASERVAAIQKKIDEFLKSKQIIMAQLGINPWHSTEQIGLQMPKKRYQAMTDYFNEIGPYGIKMMRQTCTIQVNLDFGATNDILSKRYLAAQLISPFATAFFANSPIVEGKLTGHKSFRSYIWQNLDSTRTGFPDIDSFADSLNHDLVFKSYVDFAMNAQVIFKEDPEFDRAPPNYTMREWCLEAHPDHRPSAQEINTHLSLLFPEVRARGFLELRGMDSLPRGWQFVPAAFWTGLLYDQNTLHKVLELLLEHRQSLRDFWKLSSGGLQQAQGFGKLAQEVFDMARQGFEALPPCFRNHCDMHVLNVFAERFVEQMRSPADDLIEIGGKGGHLALDSILKLNDNIENDIRKCR